MKKVFIGFAIVVVLLGGAAGGWFYLRQRNLAATNQSEILRTAEITRGDLVLTVPASGSLSSNQRSDLSFKLPGRIQHVYVEVGDQVKAGQALASIDTRDMQRAVELAQIALDQAKINLSIITKPSDPNDIELAEMAVQDAQQALNVATLNKELAAAQAALSNRMAREVRDDVREAYLEFQKVLERYNLPYAYGARITAANMEAEGNVGVTALRGNFNIQQAESSRFATYFGLQQAEQSLADISGTPDNNQLAQAELQIEQAQLNVDQAQQQLEDAVIYAPYDSTISAINISQGLIAPSNLPAISIIDNQSLFVDVSIDEIDINKTAVQQPVEILLDAYPDVTLDGVVKEIEEVPNNTSGIISYNVRITLSDPKTSQPRDGMTASVFIQTSTIPDALLIPNWAIRTDQTTSETFVYCNCLVDGTPQRTPIETGLRNDTYTQVLSGIEEGATVVLIAEERNLFDLGGGPPSLGD